MRIESYAWAGGREAMLRFGPERGPVVVIAPPLFEEANRARAFIVTICRSLAARGVASALPDLPGQGESIVPMDKLSLLDVAHGYEGAVDEILAEGRRAYGVAIRSGALLDKLGLLFGRWHLAPQDGPDLLHELTRIRQAAEPDKRLCELWFFDPDLPEDAPDPPVEIAGNLIGTSLLTDLTVYAPWQPGYGGPVRSVRLNTDPRPADRHVPGPPLWRRAEPGDHPVLAALLAEDIATWVAACEG